MKYEIGTFVYVDWFGDVNKVEILNYYPNTDRYEIIEENNYKRKVKSCEIFENESELFLLKIGKIDSRIKRLQEKREKYKVKLLG